jgi:trigger factor
MTEVQVSVESQEGLQRKMRVQVPADRIEQEVENRLRNVGRSARLKGFRPGKAPPRVIRQRYGGQVRQEVLEEFLQTSYSEAISRENLRPAGGPRIEPETVEEGKDLTYTATFEIYPDVELQGLDAMKIVRPDITVGESDVDDMLETLRKQRSTWSAVERAAADGDRVTIDFEGTVKGEPIEGGQGEQVPMVLGSGQMLPDFEKNLAGLSAGDGKTFKLKFPKDYHANELAGQKASFAVKVSEVAERLLPDLDQEFVKGFGIESGEIDDFRTDVRRNMEREAAAKAQAEVKRQAMEALLQANPIQIPAVLVEQQAAGLQSETMRSMGIEDPDKAPPRESFRDTAEKRVRLGLLVGAVIRENQIEVDRDRLNVKVDEMCASYQDPEAVRKIYFQNQELLGQVESLVLEEQVVEWLVSQAAVENKPTSFHDLMND